DLDEPFGLARHLGTTEDAEGKRSDAHVVAASLGFAFGEADAADFRIAIRAARNVVVVEGRRILSGNSLGRENALGRRHMRELRMSRLPECDDVADRRD